MITSARTYFRSLIGYQTVEEWVAYSAAKLAELGSEVSDWNVGSTNRLLVELTARIREGLDAAVADVAMSGVAQFARGKWLDLHLASVGLQRETATRARHTLTLVCTSPVTLVVGQVFATPPNGQGQVYRFRVLTAATIAAPGGTSLVEAVSAGSAWNVGPGTITVPDAPIAGLTSVTNAPGSLTRAGTDDETDDEALIRYEGRYELLSQATALTYEALAQAADAEVIGVTIIDDHPRGPGSVDIIITTVSGMPTEEAVDTVQAYIDARKPLTDDALVKGPDAVEFTARLELSIDPDATDEELDAVETEASERWSALFTPSSTLDPRLATEAPPAPVSALAPGEDCTVARIIVTMMACRAAIVRNVRVLNADGSAALADQVVARDELAQGTLGLLTITRLGAL